MKQSRYHRDKNHLCHQILSHEMERSQAANTAIPLTWSSVTLHNKKQHNDKTVLKLNSSPSQEVHLRGPICRRCRLSPSGYQKNEAPTASWGQCHRLIVPSFPLLSLLHPVCTYHALSTPIQFNKPHTSPPAQASCQTPRPSPWYARAIYVVTPCIKSPTDEISE
jgi:hypothetical protein